MLKINGILKKIGISGPESEYWLQFEKKFREKYQELLNMIEANEKGLFDEDIKIADEKLCQIIYELHEFDEDDIEGMKSKGDIKKEIKIEKVVENLKEKEISQQSTVNNKQKKSVEKPDIVPEVEEKTDTLSENPENNNKAKEIEQDTEHSESEKNESDMEKEEKQPEVIENTEIKETEELKAEETPESVIEHSQNEKNIEEPVIENVLETKKENEYPELNVYLGNHNKIAASQLVKFGVPREMWNEDSYQFEFGDYTFKKTVPGDLLFNQWTVFKKTNTGL